MNAIMVLQLINLAAEAAEQIGTSLGTLSKLREDNGGRLTIEDLEEYVARNDVKLDKLEEALRSRSSR